ncbi:unnamed protein product [Orchesella dallaii]|uniref:Uncharacterized protein n=1 Tax=Orchesella dallaii TaxID=48710 RepID=A0ABP1RA79_9HEXA
MNERHGSLFACAILSLILMILNSSDCARFRDQKPAMLQSLEDYEKTLELVINGTRILRAAEPELTLITFLQSAVKNYGQKKVAKSIYELAQKNMYDLIWMLAGDLDTFLIFDLYNLYSAAQSDTQVLSVYERFRAGNVSRAIVPEVFALDRKYDQYEWWQRVRGRMLASVDKYIAGKQLSTATAPPIVYDKDGKPIIAGIRIPDSSTIYPPLRVVKVASTIDPVDIDSDEDLLEFLNFEE